MIRAELQRLCGIPAIRITLLIGILVPPFMTAMTCAQINRNLAGGRPGAFVDTADLGFAETHMLLPCAIVFGVLAVAQEFSSGPARQGSGCEHFTVHLAIPRRRRHALTVSALVLLGSAATCGIALAISRVLAQVALGHEPEWGPDAVQRGVGLIGTWAVIALLASALTWVSRSIVLPLVVLIVGSSLVPLSFLLRSVTSLARYFPDAAGTGLALRSVEVEPLPYPIAMITLAVWTVAALIVATETTAWRDS